MKRRIYNKLVKQGRIIPPFHDMYMVPYVTEPSLPELVRVVRYDPDGVPVLHVQGSGEFRLEHGAKVVGIK